MKTKAKRIVVAFRLAGEPGRRKFGGFLRYLSEHELDWQLQFVRIQEDFSKELVSSFIERGIDGIVFSMPSAKAGAAELAQLDIPTVALDVYDESILMGRVRNLVYIGESPESVGSVAARHFLSQGSYRSYGFVPDIKGHSWSKIREQAFIDEMGRNGFLVAVYRMHRQGYDLPRLAEWIARRPKPAALFVAFDDRAVQVLEACRETNADIPRDVAVMGVDNDEMLCANTTPPLTSVQPDHDRMGYLAAEKLAALMDGPPRNSPERISVDISKIVIRDSTSPTSNAGRLVQRALAYIQTHAADAIKPRDVARHLKVSRSLADLRFRELQHESIGDTIRRHRLEEVRRRLVSTNDTLDNIAADCHFAKLCRLNEAFLSDYGCTMSEYRANHRLQHGCQGSISSGRRYSTP